MRFALLLLAFLAALPALPADVKIIHENNSFQLFRDSKPYFVKGAVGSVRLEQLAAAGGNSIRSGPDSLDRAEALGLTVLVNLPLGKQRWGFDFNDQAALEAQRREIRGIVEKHKKHPAVLMWAIGNESEIQTTPEQRRRMWAEVDKLAAKLHQLDPAHPVLTVIGDAYRRILHEAREQCPHLDAIGLNSYQDMLTMPEDVAAEGWDRPYLVTEFGPRGHWQVSKTAWKLPIEDTSTEKAEFYEKAYRHAVMNQPNCLGSYVFHWSQHHEKTHTWYGMFLEDGSRTEAVDRMTSLWSGKWPANRSPKLSRIQAEPAGGVYPSGSELRCSMQASDPDGDPLQILWELRLDVSGNPNVGGDREPPTPPIPGAVAASRGPNATILLPKQPADYRIFVYVRDGKGNAATANLPVRAVPAGGAATGKY